MEGKVEPFPFLHTSSGREAISVAWNSKSWGERKSGSNDFIQKGPPLSQKAQDFQCYLLQVSHCPISGMPVAALSSCQVQMGNILPPSQILHPKS